MRVTLLVIAALGWVACSSGKGGRDIPYADPGTADPLKVDAVPSDLAPVNHPLLENRFLNIAHRGGGRLAPEETLPAYANAIAVGADMLEMDLRATLDWVVVLMHDDTVDRTTDGTGRIRDMSFDELRTLDAGYSFTPDGGLTYPYRGKSVVIPTFREVLHEHPDRFFSAEIKQDEPSIVDAVLLVLDETQMTDHVILVSFFDDVVHEIRNKRPDAVTGASLTEMFEFQLVVSTGVPDYSPPCPFFQVAAIDRDSLELAHLLEMKVQVWTINDGDEMRSLLDMGVDGIMTDDPALLAGIIAERR